MEREKVGRGTKVEDGYRGSYSLKREDRESSSRGVASGAQRSIEG